MYDQSGYALLSVNVAETKRAKTHGVTRILSQRET